MCLCLCTRWSYSHVWWRAEPASRALPNTSPALPGSSFKEENTQKYTSHTWTMPGQKVRFVSCPFVPMSSSQPQTQYSANHCVASVLNAATSNTFFTCLNIRNLLFMPVKYLVNVPKNNLVFSLHVLGYAFGVHCSHVALQRHSR